MLKSHEIIGKRLSIKEVLFDVMEIEEYPVEKISSQYKDLLEFPAGALVAIMYRGTLIPNITTQKGVVRLLKISVEGTIYNRPGKISDALGIDEAMYAYDISEV